VSLVAGASGTGKSVLATQFISEGIRQGDPELWWVFEERAARVCGAGQQSWSGFKNAAKREETRNSLPRPLDFGG